MKPLAQLSRHVPDAFALQELMNAVEKKYTVQDAPAQVRTLNFYDSFDWRLYTAGLLCFEQDGRLRLSDLIGQEIVPSLVIPGETPGFCRHLPDSALQKKIAPVLEMRTLLLQSSFTLTTRRLRILNKEKKTVAILVPAELSAGDEQPVCSVRLHAVRGYEKWFQRLQQDLENIGRSQPGTKEQELKTALAIKGRKPQEYSSKFNVVLQP
ncbi:MAG: hypothetical protein D3906_14070, partial [Candidatus Electrothrix sp. AUS1_2]|nr:hypothetical protein [Candidatus Electrothrix sp. AUS1_2]